MAIRIAPRPSVGMTLMNLEHLCEAIDEKLKSVRDLVKELEGQEGISPMHAYACACAEDVLGAIERDKKVKFKEYIEIAKSPETEAIHVAEPVTFLQLKAYHKAKSELSTYVTYLSDKEGNIKDRTGEAYLRTAEKLARAPLAFM